MDPTRPDPADGADAATAPAPAASRPVRWPSARRAAAVAAVPALMAALYAAHVDGASGPDYWRWPWQSLGAWRLAVPAALCALPFAAAQWLFLRRPGRAAAPLLLVTASMFALQVTLAAMQWSPASLERIWRVVASPGATSYLNEALHQQGKPDFLARWPGEQAGAVIHAQNKPAGPVLYYLGLLDLVGPPPEATFEEREAALIRLALGGGLLVALLGALGVPATYGLILALTGRREAAFAGASALAFMPGPVLFTPEFDQAFPLLTAALLGTWAVALRRDRLRWSLACGATLALLLFVTYLPLVLGLSVVGLAVLHLLRQPGRETAGRVAVHAAVVLAAAAALHLVLWAATGYDVVAAFRAALASQAVHLEALDRLGMGRPWPRTIPFDLMDFFLGAGWVAPALAAAWAARSWRRPDRPDLGVGAVCVLQVLLTAATGLLQGETARVWIFLLPVLLVPASLELAAWSPRGRAAAFAGGWAVLVVAAANLVFITP